MAMMDDPLFNELGPNNDVDTAIDWLKDNIPPFPEVTDYLSSVEMRIPLGPRKVTYPKEDIVSLLKEIRDYLRPSIIIKPTPNEIQKYNEYNNKHSMMFLPSELVVDPPLIYVSGITIPEGY